MITKLSMECITQDGANKVSVELNGAVCLDDVIEWFVYHALPGIGYFADTDRVASIVNGMVPQGGNNA